MASRGETRNFHVPLSSELHRRLHAAARRSDRPATALAREAIEEHLANLDRRILGEEVRRYAEAQAGTSADLDEELEATGVSELLRLAEEE
jgi:predicted DNA-binding protein